MASKINMDPIQPDIHRSGVICTGKLATVNRVARLLSTDEAGLARMHRISNDGVELSSIMDLAIGQAIRLDLSEAVSLPATVIARDGKRYGLEFEQKVNCAVLLRQLVEEARSSRARPLRLATGLIMARGLSLEGVHELEVGDISQRGMRVRHNGGFRPGLRLCVQLPNGLECRGIVRWTRDRSAGLMLTEILSVDDVGAVSRLCEEPVWPER
jgi:hypothetical protein